AWVTPGKLLIFKVFIHEIGGPRATPSRHRQGDYGAAGPLGAHCRQQCGQKKVTLGKKPWVGRKSCRQDGLCVSGNQRRGCGRGLTVNTVTVIAVTVRRRRLA